MQDLETGIQKLKELKQWSDRIGSDEHHEINEIVNLLTQAKDYQEEKDKRSIIWSVDDFITQAEQSFSKYIEARCWQDIYDESKFEEQLYEMIDNHDAEDGVSWQTIDCYLEYCLKDKL